MNENTPDFEVMEPDATGQFPAQKAEGESTMSEFERAAERLRENPDDPAAKAAFDAAYARNLKKAA